MDLRRLTRAPALPLFADVHVIWLKQRTLSPVATRAIQLAQQIGARIEQTFADP